MYFELKNISVHYDKVLALENVTLHVEQGEIVALIGANGAGKTSTLRAITALARPSSGEIWFGGKRIDRLEPAAVVALGISMVPEGRHVYPFMSVKDNLLMGAYLRKDKGEIKQRSRQDLHTFSESEGATETTGRQPLRRRTTDGRYQPRADGAAEVAAAGRAVARACADGGSRYRASHC